MTTPISESEGRVPHGRDMSMVLCSATAAACCCCCNSCCTCDCSDVPAMHQAVQTTTAIAPPVAIPCVCRIVSIYVATVGAMSATPQHADVDVDVDVIVVVRRTGRAAPPVCCAKKCNVANVCMRVCLCAYAGDMCNQLRHIRFKYLWHRNAFNCCCCCCFCLLLFATVWMAAVVLCTAFAVSNVAKPSRTTECVCVWIPTHTAHHD